MAKAEQKEEEYELVKEFDENGNCVRVEIVMKK